jgi:hypothetical protein
MCFGMHADLVVRARVVESSAARATVEAHILAIGKITATSRAIFVAVQEGRPAFNRW